MLISVRTRLKNPLRPFACTDRIPSLLVAGLYEIAQPRRPGEIWPDRANVGKRLSIREFVHLRI